MTKKQIKSKVDEDLYFDFKKEVKRVYGKIHGNMSLAVEDAIKVYMRVGLDPDYKPLASSTDTISSEGGGSSNPKNKVLVDNFIHNFKERFYGYSRVSTKELTNFIMSETSARSDTTIKKWRNRLRDNNLISYTSDGWWKIDGPDTGPGDHQSQLSYLDEIYEHFQPGDRATFNKIREYTNKSEKGAKSFIKQLVNNGRLKYIGPGFWRVLGPNDEIESFENVLSESIDD